jgi:CHRD domain
MGISTLRRAVVALAGVACVGAAALAEAAPVSFTVPLSGSEQVPPVQTQGTGTANLTYDRDTRVVTWNITYSGLSSDTTMAHIHGPGPIGKNAPPIIWLSKRGSSSVTSPMTGQATLSPEQAQEFLAGNTYVNVHTKQHPDGEMRGQIIPPKKQ